MVNRKKFVLSRINLLISNAFFVMWLIELTSYKGGYFSLLPLFPFSYNLCISFSFVIIPYFLYSWYSLINQRKQKHFIHQEESNDIFNSNFFNNWFIHEKEECITIYQRQGLNIFWYLFFFSCISFLLSLGFALLNPLAEEDKESTIIDSKFWFNFFFPDDIAIEEAEKWKWAKAVNSDRIAYILGYTLWLILFFFPFPILVLITLNLLSFFAKKYGKKLFANFSFHSAENWLKQADFKKGTQKRFIQKEIPRCERKIKFFDFSKWLFMLLAVTGSLLTIKFNQGGNAIGITSIVGSQLADKGKERNQSTINELEKLEKELNQEFLRDFFIVLKIRDLRIIYADFLKENVELNNKNLLFSSILNGIKNREPLLSSKFSESENEKQKKEITLTGKLIQELEREEKKQQFLNDLQTNWNEEINEKVNDLWKKIKNWYKNDNTKTSKILEFDIPSLFFFDEEKGDEISVEIPETQPNSPNFVSRLARKFSLVSRDSLRINNLV